MTNKEMFLLAYEINNFENVSMKSTPIYTYRNVW